MTGELISLVVAISWTVTALFADIASHRMGALTLNLIRMVLSLLLLAILLWCTTGSPLPVYADGRTWGWLLLSGAVGYVFGDYCLFNSYVIFGSRYGQLFMTIAPPVAGIAGWLMLGERMSLSSILAMCVTLAGIALSILVRKGPDSQKLTLKLPLKGVLYGIGAGVGQGVGLVLSKIGLEHYSLCLPAEMPGSFDFVMPFAGTFIRAVAGLAGFFVILALQKKLGSVPAALRDGRGMTFVAMTTFFGPFLGVSLSLMAVQYANAGVASTLMALTPVLIIAPYAIINHQRISLKEIAGTLITVIGVAMFFLL